MDFLALTVFPGFIGLPGVEKGLEGWGSPGLAVFFFLDSVRQEGGQKRVGRGVGRIRGGVRISGYLRHLCDRRGADEGGRKRGAEGRAERRAERGGSELAVILDTCATEK